jgi:uncharacterized protein YjaZ
MKSISAIFNAVRRCLGLSVHLLPVVCVLFAGRGFSSVQGSNSPEVVLGFDAIAAWAADAASKPTADKNELFERIVIGAYKSQCFAGPALPTDVNQLTGMVFGNPAGWDLAQVRKEIEILDQNKEKLLQEIKRSFAKSSRRLRALSAPRICVFYFQPKSPVRDRMHGVMGFTPSQHLIDLYVSPLSGWIPWVGYNVAHEYHHTQWMARNPDRDTFQFTLLEYLVFEGRADNFASQITNLSGAWSHALSTQEQCKVFTEIEPQWSETGPVLPKVMFGWPGSGYPQWSGYTLGFGIVHSFLKLHPKNSIESWTSMSAANLFAASHYSPCTGRSAGT